MTYVNDKECRIDARCLLAFSELFAEKLYGLAYLLILQMVNNQSFLSFLCQIPGETQHLELLGYIGMFTPDKAHDILYAKVTLFEHA